MDPPSGPTIRGLWIECGASFRSAADAPALGDPHRPGGRGVSSVPARSPHLGAADRRPGHDRRAARAPRLEGGGLRDDPGHRVRFPCRKDQRAGLSGDDRPVHAGGGPPGPEDRTDRGQDHPSGRRASGTQVITEGGAAVPVIEADGLAKRYGPVAAVESVDLVVTPGQSVALFGPNGAGKSTLLRLFATLLRPTTGRLRLFGADVSASDAAALRRRIGFLSHHTFLYEHLTGLENLLFYARLYSLPDPAGVAREAIGAARLENRRDDRVGSYSRGMQQRLAIARVLMHRPDILLLDEPFTGLDRPSCSRLEAALEGER